MAIFDREEQKIVVRIIYDGPACAGKTTNVKELCNFFTTRRRSDVITPGEIDGRTLFFDWLHIDGGLVSGYTLRCQLATVPGQSVLYRRRQHLLRTADVVVFVCDSTPRGVEEGKRMYEALLDILGTSPPPVPVVVQANKQDLPGALDPATVLSALGVPDGVVVPARAHEGAGVREAAVLAIRAAANHVQRLVLDVGIDALAGTSETSDALYRAMLAADVEANDGIAEKMIAEVRGSTEPAPASVFAPEPAPEPALASEPAPVPSPPPDTQSSSPAVVVSEAKTDPPTWRPVMTEHAPVEPPPPAEAEDETFVPPLPDPDVPSGYIWPAATGRDVLRRIALAGPLQRRDDLVGTNGARDGSGSSDLLLYEARPWCLKTSERRRHRDADEARTALLRLARKKIQLGPLMPPDTVLVLRHDERGDVWLWTIAPWLTTLGGRTRRAEQASDEAALQAALADFARAATAAMVLNARSEVVLDVHPSNFAVDGDSVFYLDDDIGAGSHNPAIGYSLLQRVEEHVNRPRIVERYLSILAESMAAQLMPEDVTRLDLVRALGDAIVRTPLAHAARERLIAVASAMGARS